MPLRKILAYAIMITIGILVMKVAPVIYSHETVANGILGLAMIYLIYQVFLSQGSAWNKDSIEGWLEFPKNIRYFIIAFFWSIILYFALDHIFQMLLFLTK